MRIQNHEINKFQLWYFNSQFKRWLPYGRGGYDTEEKAIRSALMKVNQKTGELIEGNYWKDTEWKIVKII